MSKIVWTYDYEECTMDPNDGKGPIPYWWEDIRSREVREMVKEAYERGYRSRIVEEEIEGEQENAYEY